MELKLMTNTSIQNIWIFVFQDSMGLVCREVTKIKVLKILEIGISVPRWQLNEWEGIKVDTW